MPLKLVLISPSGTLVKDGKLDRKDMAELGNVVAKLAGQGVTVAVWSNQAWTVGSEKIKLETYLTDKAGVEVHYVGLQNGMPPRQRAGSIDPILARFGVRLEEVILVGARDEDMQAGVNNKLLLLRPAWYGGALSYGFELKSISELGRFCLLFGLRTHPFYWRVADGPHSLDVRALGPFSTYIEAFAKFGADAMGAAKFEAGTLEFWHQLIVSTLYFSGIIHKIDFITVYPGHASAVKHKAFHEVLDLLGKCFGKTFLHDLLIRHENAEKSAYKKAGDRKFITQLNTLRLNRFPAKYGGTPRKTPIKLTNKCVLVVDDICTSGRSLDTARSYIGASGASVVLFAWLKTINTSFVSMDPAPVLKPFEVNTIANEPTAKSYGYAEHIVDAAAADELSKLLNEFQAWTA